MAEEECPLCGGSGNVEIVTPDYSAGKDFYSCPLCMSREHGEETAKLEARIAFLEARRDELQAANSAYLIRARNAEAKPRRSTDRKLLSNLEAQVLKADALQELAYARGAHFALIALNGGWSEEKIMQHTGSGRHEALCTLKELRTRPSTSMRLMPDENFQSRVGHWMQACFGPQISADRIERNHRFLEEALELVQACGCTAHEAHQLVDYVFNRPVGDPPQEVGGVMVTLAGLCLANGFDMHKAAETELARVWTKIKQIRAKHAAKPKHSPLPGAAP